MWRRTMGRRGDHANGTSGGEGDHAGADVELGEIIVEPTTNGEKATRVEPADEGKEATGEEDDGEERFCRICLEPISLSDGKSLLLGCACKSGYMHKSCAWDYVEVKRTKPVTCEVCLEDMSGLDGIAELQGEESRAMLRARAALLRVNGENPRDHDGEADPTFDDTDPREGRICWGSRNPLVWLVWLVTRPIIGVVWVSLPARIRPPARSHDAASTALTRHSPHFPRYSSPQLFNHLPVAAVHWLFIVTILTFWAAVLWMMYDSYDSSFSSTG